MSFRLGAVFALARILSCCAAAGDRTFPSILGHRFAELEARRGINRQTCSGRWWGVRGEMGDVDASSLTDLHHDAWYIDSDVIPVTDDVPKSRLQQTILSQGTAPVCDAVSSNDSYTSGNRMRVIIGWRAISSHVGICTCVDIGAMLQVDRSQDERTREDGGCSIAGWFWPRG